MLELYGSGYVIDHVVSAHLEYTETHIFRTYIANSLRLHKDTPFYSDLIDNLYNSLKGNQKPEKSGDEIAMEVIKNAGLKVVG